ncbi:hypothetical protein GGI21_003768, partial [Coemansia aciculifera]
MACLKALDLEAPLGSQFRLLLPATINDFVPGGSSEGYRLDSVLTLYPWATTVDAIIAMYKDADSDKSKGTDADKPRKKNKTRPQYAEIFAVVEAKVAYKPTTGKESTHPTLLKAQGQLVLYNRQVYEHQHGRLFTWGMTVCGSLVRAYHFGPDIILDSGDLDVTESAGRRMLVEWLVRLSLAEDFCRGFNPCVMYVSDASQRAPATEPKSTDDKEDDDQGYAEGEYTEDQSSEDAEDEDSEYTDGESSKRANATVQGCWDIKVPRLDGNGAAIHGSAVYFSRGPNFKAGSNFGRHTRGFPVSTELANIDKPDLFVKTAWQFANRTESPVDGSRSEFANLRRITTEFAKGARPAVRVPLLLNGGVATIDINRQPMQLTTDAIYTADILERHGSDATESEPRIWYRELYMFATSPLCRPLDTAKSVDELIIALADAMHAHATILRDCNLLHRDVSTNNIMIGEETAPGGDGSTVYGLLVDFDYAVSTDCERSLRPERTGTVPFMSMLNLEADCSARTELDDWESLLYVLCWMATHGINEKDRQVLANAKKGFSDPASKIGGWAPGRAMNVIAKAKRRALESRRAFIKSITNFFSGPVLADKLSGNSKEIPDYTSLETLALDLYKTLFDNRDVGLDCRGSSKESILDAKKQENGDLIDLFKELRIDSFDPFSRRAKEEIREKIAKGLLKVMDKHATLAKERMAASDQSKSAAAVAHTPRAPRASATAAKENISR